MLEMFSDLIDPNDPEIKKLIEKHRKTIKDLQAKAKKTKGGKLSPGDQKKLDAASEALKGLTDPSKEPNPDGSPKSDLASLTEQARQAADALRNPDQQPKPSDQQPKPSDQGQPQQTADQGQPKPSDQGQPQDPSNDKGQPQDPSADKGQPKPSPDGQPQDPSEDPLNDPSKAPPQTAAKPPEPKKNLPDQLRDVEQKKRDQRAQDKLNDLQERLNEESRRAQNEARPADQKPSQMQDFLDRARGQEPKAPQSAGQDDPQNPQDPQGSQQGAPKGSDKSSAQDPKNPKPGQGDQRADSTKPGDPTNLPAEQDADKTSGQASSAQNGNNPKGTQDPGKGDTSKFSPSDGDEVKIGGVDNGEGPKEPTADVIKDAAHSGFATTSYQDIHTQYTRYAEEAMDRDKVPPGYRHYIHLYFDYIGPRQNPSSPPSP
jgi:hypothetical protein